MANSLKPTWGERMTNPVIKHATKTSETSEGANAVTYKSVYFKTALFLLTFIVGVALAFVVHSVTEQIPIEGLEQFSISQTEIILFFVSIGVGIVGSIVASLSYRLAGIFGALSCIGYGYMLGILAVCIPSYQGPILLALVLTVAVVAGLILLYRTGVIKVTQKFKAIVAILFWSMIVGSLLMLVLYFIPVTRDAVVWLSSNPIISLLCAVFSVIIASLFLLCDFDSVVKAVENGADKKYENMLAFGLAFSVIWLYFKILQLLLTIMGKRS